MYTRVWPHLSVRHFTVKFPVKFFQIQRKLTNFGKQPTTDVAGNREILKSEFAPTCYNRSHFRTFEMNENDLIVTKSEHDTKEYKVLYLPNGITALIVSDPSPVPKDSSVSVSSSSDSDSESSESESEEIMSTSTENDDTSSESDASEEGDEKLAAVSLLVDVGSFSDPPDINGLAHFLEHMIFMGSQQYPQENDFDSFLKKRGGFSNANTEYEETCFYFEIDEENLDEAMSRFAALFTAPLMRIDAMQREREAVESEFQTEMHDDDVRRLQILAEAAQPDHPCGIFAWGNLKTLKDNVTDQELYKRVHEFRTQHYSAHRMYVCAQARLPIDVLEELVVRNFSNVPCNNLPKDDFSAFNHENAFKNEFYDNVYYVKPVGNAFKLDITWCLPTLLTTYRSKPVDYVASILGHEGPGSLCAYLRRKLWSFELIAGTDDFGFEFNSLYSLFNIFINLTEDGFQHLDEVLAATFSYIKLLFESGPNESLFRELQNIEETAFRFQSDSSAYDNVKRFVIGLKYFPPKDVLTGSEIYFEYDEKAISNIINYLNTKKFNIMITSMKTPDGIVYDKKEKWFGTEYTNVPVPQKWTELWKNAKPLPEFHLPEPNIYITNDFTIFHQNGYTNSQYPRKIVNTDICEVWFRQDDKFLLPQCYMNFYFMSPLPVKSAKNTVLLTLYLLLLKHNLAEKLYAALVAGLNYHCLTAENGILLQVSGYNEKIHLIIDIITKSMANFLEDIDDEKFKVFVLEQKCKLHNWFIRPKSLNKDVRLSIVEQIRYPSFNKYKIVDNITLGDLKTFSIEYLKELKIQALLQGNLTEESAHNIMNIILRNIECSSIKDEENIERRTMQLPLGTNYVICKSFNQNDVNTVVTNFYQVGPVTVYNESLLDLLMEFVEDSIFDILRTKEQLGYDVSASVRNNYGIIGYTITVNSQEDKYSAAYIEQRIEAFRVQMLQILQDMSQEDFEQTRSSLIDTKLMADNDLKEEFDRNWSEIACKEYIFDRNKKEADCLRSLTKDDIINFCRNYEMKDLRKLSVQVIGNTSTDEPKNESFELQLFKENATITNINEFKKDLYVYPVTKTSLDMLIINSSEAVPLT